MRPDAGRLPAEIEGSNPAVGRRCLSFGSVVFCQVEVSATSWSLSGGALPTVVRRSVWSRNLKNEEAMTRVGSQRHRKKHTHKTYLSHLIHLIHKIYLIYLIYLIHKIYLNDLIHQIYLISLIHLIHKINLNHLKHLISLIQLIHKIHLIYLTM